MSQTISVSVQMTQKNFRDFRVFDVFRHQKAWKRPLIFAVILLTSAVICLSQVGKREGALLLTVVLTVVALGLPGVYFGTFFHQLSQIIKKMKLPQPFYRVELSGDGVAVWLAGEQDKPLGGCAVRLPHRRCHLPVCSRSGRKSPRGQALPGLPAGPGYGQRMGAAGLPARRQAPGLPEITGGTNGL